MSLTRFPLEDDMQTFDDKVDTAVHVAFIALGLSVATHMELAMRLNDFITQEFQFVVTDDDEDENSASNSVGAENNDAE
jgi:hypothetical protein